MGWIIRIPMRFAAQGITARLHPFVELHPDTEIVRNSIAPPPYAATVELTVQGGERPKALHQDIKVLDMDDTPQAGG